MNIDKKTTPEQDTPSPNRPSAIRPKNQPNHLLRTIVIIAVIGMAVWVWDATKYRLFPKRFGVVEQGALYRSGQIHPELIEKTLRKHNIKVVVSLLGDDPNDPAQQAEIDAATKLGLDYKRFPLLGDGTGDLENYVQAIEAIVLAKKQGQPVLVHCAAGAQRTGGAVAFYQLLVEGKSPDQVYSHMRKYDWHDKPDAPLLPYINKHMEAMAQRLLELRIIDQIPDPLPKLKSKNDA